MPTIIRDCKVPHHGVCNAVLSTSTVLATLESHGFEARVNADGDVEAFEPSTTISFKGGPARDTSSWVPVPRDVHDLAAWLGY